MNEEAIKIKKELILNWIHSSLPYSFKKLAVECYQKRDHIELPYFLIFIFIYMELETCLYQIFSSMKFSARAGISTIFKEEELRVIIKNSKLGDLFKTMKYLQNRLNIIDSSKKKIEIVTHKSKEEYLLKRLCSIRHFLIHGQFQGIPSLGVAGSHVPLQECNTLDDIHNSFKIYLTFEPRLYFIKKYVESTIFPCVLSGFYGARNNNNRDMKRIHFHIFESPSKQYKPLVSINDEPPIQLGNLAMCWDSFHNYRHELWSFCEFQNSIEEAKYGTVPT